MIKISCISDLICRSLIVRIFLCLIISFVLFFVFHCLKCKDLALAKSAAVWASVLQSLFSFDSFSSMKDLLGLLRNFDHVCNEFNFLCFYLCLHECIFPFSAFFSLFSNSLIIFLRGMCNI